MVALCGGGDRPIAALGGRTPFEAAPTPNLDAMTAEGVSGLITVIRPDIPPESDSGAMALLGYDPLRHYTGRGPLEGLGMGFWDPDGWSTAFRINFASWNPENGRLDRRTSRDLRDDELAALVGEVADGVRLDPEVRMRITGFGRHRGIMSLTSRTLRLSGRVSNTDPGFRGVAGFGVPVAEPASTPLPCEPLEDTEEAARTARLVNEFVAQSAEILQRSDVNRRRRRAGRLPANLILVRDGGDSLPRMAAFRERTGRSLSMYGQVPAERGLAGLIGASFTVAKAATGQPDPDFFADLLPALLGDPADVIFVHLKGPDEPGHDGRPADKVRAVTDIDAAFVGPLRDAVGADDVVVVTCDHATPCELGIHAPDRVPLVVAGGGVKPDGVGEFGERSCAAGGLPLDRAADLLPWLIDASGGR